MDYTIDYSKLIKDIEDFANKFQEFFNDICEVIKTIADKIAEIIRDNIKKEKPKYKLIKSLIKPYKQPIIKIKAKARSNL